MATKLGKSSYPSGHGPNDFKCFGPPATEDGQFDNCKIADMGSFSQEEVDSNKYYVAMVCQSKINSKFYTYFEWGRVGASKPQFQMVECGSEAEAQREFAAQCHEKNDKRGVWTTIAGQKTLTAKPGKDVYLVRQLATRSTGLPDAKTIKSNEGAKPKAVKTTAKKEPARRADPHTAKLLKDLIGGTISYTRGSMADASLPSQNAIDMGRTLLTEAQKRLGVVGDNVDDQIRDRELRAFSSELYRRIPKKKAVGTPDNVWILSQNNILSWQNDLDAFESALNSQEFEDEKPDVDPFHGLPLHMEWIDPKTELGQFLHYWWPRSTANKHGGIGNMNIHNLWKVDRFGDEAKLNRSQDKVLTQLQNQQIKERAYFQPSERTDLDKDTRKIFEKSNTAMLLHGTRSANVSGILRESLRMPKELVGVPIAGAMFGSGAYFADDFKKSAGYTSMYGSYWARGQGAVAGRHAFMFAADVILGQPYFAPHSGSYKGPPAGHHCIFARGSNLNPKSHSGVQNNEWITFDVSHIRLRYLVEFSTK